MKNIPTVSVIIPTYNYAHTINDAIDSVFASTFPPEEIEIIVVDDGSTDITAKVVSKYGSLVRYVYQENLGKAAATHTAIKLARGQYVLNLDADDTYLPDKIQKTVKVFEKYANVVHVATPALIWDEQSGVKAAEKIPRAILAHPVTGNELLVYFYRRNMLFGGGSTYAARTKVVKKIPIPQAVDMHIDEYLVLHTLRYGDSFFIDEPLSIWRVHHQNYSGKNHSDAIQEISRLNRNLKSQESVLRSVIESDFPQEIKSLYQLKRQYTILAAKESTNEEKARDVWLFWKHFISCIGLLQMSTPLVFHSYRVLNRTVPTKLIRLLRQARSQWMK